MAQPVLDTLRLADRFKKCGFTDQQAEGAARALGDELTERVVTRTDLENAIGLVRADLRTLDAKWEARFDAVDSKFESVDSRLDAVDSRFESVDSRFDAVDSRFESVDSRFDAVDSQFESVDSRFDAVDSQFESVDSRFDAVDSQFESVDSRFDAVDARLNALGSQIRFIFAILGVLLALGVVDVAITLAG